MPVLINVSSITSLIPDISLSHFTTLFQALVTACWTIIVASIRSGTINVALQPVFLLPCYFFPLVNTLYCQSCLTLRDLKTIALQAPLSMEISRQEFWSGLPFPFPGHLPDPEIELGSPTLQADSLQSEPPGKTKCSTLVLGFYPHAFSKHYFYNQFK